MCLILSRTTTLRNRFCTDGAEECQKTPHDQLLHWIFIHFFIHDTRTQLYKETKQKIIQKKKITCLCKLYRLSNIETSELIHITFFKHG